MGVNKLGIHYIDFNDRRLDLVGVDDSNKIAFKETITLINGHIDESLIANHIQLILNKYAFKAKEVALTVSSNVIFTHPIMLPKMGKKDFENTFVYELYSAYPEFQNNYSYKVIRHSSEVSVFNYVVFCPFSLIESFNKVAKTLSFKVKSITHSGYTLFKLNEAETKMNKDSNSLILHMNEHFCIVGVVIGGDCVDYEYVDLGTEKIKKELLNQYGIYEESIDILEGEERQKLKEAVSKIIKPLYIAFTTIGGKYQYGFEKKSFSEVLINSDDNLRSILESLMQEVVGIPAKTVQLNNQELNSYLLPYASLKDLSNKDTVFSLVKQKVKIKKDMMESEKPNTPKKKKSSFWTFRLR